MADNDQWAKALEEAESPELRDKGLWARCFAEQGGDEAKAKAAYVSAKVAASAAPAVEPRVVRDGFCPNCGEDCSMGAMWCSHCKADFTGDGWRPVEKRPSQPPSPSRAQSAHTLVKSAKSRGIYIILGLFFGLLGVHNFYAGRLGVAVAQLLVTVILGWVVVGLVITAVWVLIELFVITKDGAGDPFA